VYTCVCNLCVYVCVCVFVCVKSQPCFLQCYARQSAVHSPSPLFEYHSIAYSLLYTHTYTHARTLLLPLAVLGDATLLAPCTCTCTRFLLPLAVLGDAALLASSLTRSAAVCLPSPRFSPARTAAAREGNSGGDHGLRHRL